MKLTEKLIGVIACTACTLNCRLCSLCIPAFREKKIAQFYDLDHYKRDMLEVFNIYDHVGTISLTGGDPLLHKRLADMVAFTLRELPAKFDQLRITTNGTMLPDEELLRVIHSYAKDNMLFIVDDYGEQSKKLSSIVEILERNQISYQVKHYSGENQHYGGWVDFGALDQYRGYSSEEVEHIAARCHFAQWKTLTVFDGKLFPCIRATCGEALGYFSFPEDEYIDLTNMTQTLEEKIKIASSFGRKAYLACQYCNGFDPETASRFSAAEQAT